MPAGLVLAGSLALYGLTAMRSPGWLDAGLILSGAREGRLDAYAVNHNLYNVVGYAWLAVFRFIDPSFALALLSALLGSLTVLLIYAAGRELTGNRFASALGAAGLAVSHSLWWHATTVEVYTLNTALIALMLFLVFRYFRTGGFALLVAAYGIAGLGVFNHGLMALFAPALVALALHLAIRRPGFGWRRAVILAFAYIAGCAPFLTLFLRYYVSLAGGLLPFRVDSFAATVEYATVTKDFGPFFFPTDLPAGQRLFWRANYLFLAAWNFPSAALALAAWGLWRFARAREHRGSFLFFAVGIAAQVSWSANYLIWEMYAFALPVYVMLGVPLILGVDALLTAARNHVRVPVLATFVVPALLYTGIGRLPGLHALLSRYTSLYAESEAVSDLFDPAVYIMNPVRPCYRDVERYCIGLMDTLPPASQFWDDYARAVHPLRGYYQGALGQDLGFTLHALDTLGVAAERTRQEAADMLRALREGLPVFVSTLRHPERSVLDRLWLLLDRTVSAEEVRALSAAEYRARAPFGVEAIPIDPGRPWLVYRIGPIR